MERGSEEKEREANPRQQQSSREGQLNVGDTEEEKEM